MENDNDEQALRRSFRFQAMMDVMCHLQEGGLSDLELEQARTDDGQFFSLINLVLTRGLGRFVSSTKNNISVKILSLDIGYQHVYDDYGREIEQEEYYRRWETLAQGLKNLEGLKELKVNSRELLEDPENVPDYRALGIVLQGIPQLENLSFCCSLLSEGSIAEVARALQRHPNLKQVHFEQRTDTEALDTLARSLATAPNLETVEFGFLTVQRRRLPNSLLALMGMPSHKAFKVHKCLLAESQCEILAQCFQNDYSKLDMLDLQHSRLEGAGGARLLQGLEQHGTVRSLRLSLSSLNQQSCHALAKLIVTNQSLQDLNLTGRSFIDQDNGDERFLFDPEWLSPFFDNLRSSASLRHLSIGAVDTWSHDSMDKFRAALESPKCSLASLCTNAHEIAPAWPRLMSSLAKNTSLTRLQVEGGIDRHGAIALASHLSMNTSATDLAMFVIHESEESGSGENEVEDESQSRSGVDDEFTIARCVEALGSNNSVKRLLVRFPHRWEARDVSPEGTRELEATFARNFALEEVSGRFDRDSMVPALCKLNKAGRKYLTEDPLNRARGVHVLAQVRDSLDALYFHLLENPALCEGAFAANRAWSKKRPLVEATTTQGEAKRNCTTSEYNSSGSK